VNTQSDSPGHLSSSLLFKKEKKKNIPGTSKRHRLAICIFISTVSTVRLPHHRICHYYMFTKVRKHGSGHGIFKYTMPPLEPQISIPPATAPSPNHGRSSTCLIYYCCLVQGSAHLLRTTRRYQHPPPLMPAL
jgi:hypothetical protein